MRGLKHLIIWTKNYLWLIGVLLVLSFVLQYSLSLISLAVSYVFKVLEHKDVNTVNLPQIVKNLLSNFTEPMTIIIATGLFIISLQVIRSILRYLSNYLQSSICFDICVDMKRKTFNYLLDLSYQFHNDTDNGDLIQRCTSDIDTASRYPSREFINFINIFLTVGIGAYQVFKINSWLMLACISTLPITLILSFIFYFISNKRIKHCEELESKMVTVINENVNGARVVRSFFNEKYEFNKMDDASQNLKNAQIKLGKIEGLYSGLSDALIALQYALIMIVGIILCKNKTIDSGDITACLLLTSMILWPFRGLARTIMAYGRTNVAVNRLQDIFDNKSEYIIDGTKEPKLSGEIEFKNVSYTFKEGNKVLDDISFKINSGETVAIMGRTGAGKTTIANLLVRMFDVSDGEIILDGTNINAISKHYLRRNVALILQEPFLFSRSVKDNISIKNLKASNQQIEEVAKLSHIDEEIVNFVEGYDTVVGEKGTTLSGGQKQRICIARTLLEEAPIVIFDDALSALDSKTDLEIRSSLKSRNGKQTTIVITHRTATAMNSDKIIVLDNMKISDIGTHEQLKNKRGLYHDLWKIQGELEDSLLIKGGDNNA